MLVCFLLVLVSSTIKGQRDSLPHIHPVSSGFSLYSNCSGSGLGTFYSPGFFLSKKGNLISVGPTINKSNFRISGVHLNFEHTFMGDDKDRRYDNYNEMLDIFGFSSMFYRPSTALNRKTLAMECNKSSEFKKSLENTKLQTLEAYIGFGIRIKILKNLKWLNCIGFGGYYSPNRPKGLLSGDRSESCLVFKTGLNLNLD